MATARTAKSLDSFIAGLKKTGNLEGAKDLPRVAASRLGAKNVAAPSRYRTNRLGEVNEEPLHAYDDAALKSRKIFAETTRWRPSRFSRVTSIISDEGFFLIMDTALPPALK